MNADEMATQVIDLQARIAYQEDTLLALDRVVTEQAARIDRLQARLERLLERIDAADGGAADEAPDERPPHY